MRERLRRIVREPASPVSRGTTADAPCVVESSTTSGLVTSSRRSTRVPRRIAGEKSTSTRSALRNATRRGGLPDVDGVQRDAERAGPVVETGGACLDPELIEKRRGQGAEHERLARRRGKEEGTAGEDHQQQQDENDRQAHHRAESARDEVASLRFRRCLHVSPAAGVP